MQLTPPVMCLILALGHFILLAWPRIVNPFFGVDCWRHMLAADFIRKHRRIPDTSIDNYLFEGPFDYPPLIPVFLAIFPRSFRLFLQATLSPLIEAGHGILVFLLVQQLTADATAAVLAQLLFALVPITALENSQLTARSPGSLLLTVSLVSIAVFMNGGHWLWFVVAIVAAALIHLTHKMASQALLLFSLLTLPLLPWLWGVALIGPLSLLVTFILARKLAKRILVGHIAVLRYYWRIFMAPKQVAGSVESPSLIGRLVRLAKSNPLVTAAGANPWVVFVVVAAIGSWPAASELPGTVLFWLFAVYFLIVATTVIRPMRFLGDGPRYSYYLSFPLAIAGGILIPSCISRTGLLSAVMLPALVVAGIAIVAGIVFIQLKAVVADKERSLRGDVRTIVNILKGEAGARVVVLPLCTAEIVAFFADCRILSTDSALVHASDRSFRDFNPCLIRPLSFFLEKYDITHVMVENTSSLQLVGILHLPDDFAMAFRGKDYALWTREDRAAK